MKLTSRLSERGAEGTEVFASSEVDVTGMLAQMGRGMIQDVGEQIFAKFADAMRAELEGPAAAARGAVEETPRGRHPGQGRRAPAEPPRAQAPPLDVVSLGAGAAARAAGRTMQRPAFWIAAAILAFAAI